MSFKKFFNLENDKDIAEIHKILFDSDSEGDNESEEEDAISEKILRTKKNYYWIILRSKSERETKKFCYVCL